MSEENNIPKTPEDDVQSTEAANQTPGEGVESLFDLQEPEEDVNKDDASLSQDEVKGNTTESLVKSLPKFKRSGGDRGTEKSTEPSQRIEKRRKTAQREDASGLDGEDDYGDSRQQQEERPADPKQQEIDEINRQIDAALKGNRPSRRRKGGAGDVDLDLDEVVQTFKSEMIKACERDHEDHQDNLPAIHKIQMLPSVVRELNKPDLYEIYLDNNILTAFRMWLEPFDDGALPSIDIQTTLLDLMANMPIETDHLRTSGVGKIVLFMSKCQRISGKNRRVAEQLVQNWSRPILRRSKDYRHKQISNLAARSKGATSAFDNSGEIQYGSVTAQSGGDLDEETAHARIPRRNAYSYDIVPASQLSEADRHASQQNKSNRYRLLREKMQSRGSKR